MMAQHITFSKAIKPVKIQNFLLSNVSSLTQDIFRLNGIKLQG